MSNALAQPGFPASFTEARDAWLAAVAARGGSVDSMRHPGHGPEGEALWMDAARFGAPAASKVFVVACGTHGIEGYAGSAVQTAWLAQGGPGALPEDVAVLLIHAINPWGFAHRQRVNEDNVDLNRNFRAHGETPPPANPGYAELHPQLYLNDWTEAEIAQAFAAMDAFRARVGEQGFSDAFNGGQYSHADGIFHGGDRPAWSNLAVRALLRRQLHAARECLFADLHTGIGPYGQPFLINVDPPGSEARERAIAVWGAEALSGKGSTHQALATFQGLLLDAFATELPDCRVSAVAIEFGTHERRRMQRAHLTLMWLRRQAVETPVTEMAREDYVEAFIPSDPAWRAAVMESGVALCRKGLRAVVDGTGARA
ncbi:M14 family metallopeptidase [Mitsuaria sp. GD03876]|uniref:M14 family metallopeptidase n=1 Tax=Mitsuaria sp. GD03876 TaxID=2975399 RepID=UPI00244CABE6|nr:M14 family metallopeptidase [Mitsuaria sp. GD03876]MDH0863862.1 M14 family metallopeptidase [Mitsuaria sp. GD03876]